jgi:carboxypeptidase C (cathepsin A)
LKFRAAQKRTLQGSRKLAQKFIPHSQKIKEREILNKFTYIIFFSILPFLAQGIENPLPATEKRMETPEVKDEEVETSHSILLNGMTLSYKATAGRMVIKNDESVHKANISYVAYHKDGVEEPSKRPITFCFNGGPGSASLWLHMGMLGPKRVQINSQDPSPPYQILDNPYCLLDLTDLVFIDPVSTGYSRAAPGEDPKQFYGVDGDIKSIAQFIRLYITRSNRWNSPKFLAGESYGTTRAAGLAGYLHDQYSIDLNGILFISCILNFQTVENDVGNDLPYILALPSYTAAAWVHQRLEPELMTSFTKTLEESQQFTLHDYALALLEGDQIKLNERSRIIQQLARFTGLSPQYIDRVNLRICESGFEKELLRDRKRTLGKFDCRYLGIDSNACGGRTEYDPSFDIIFGAFSAALNTYIQTDLKWNRDEQYHLLANVWPWDYGKAKNCYLNVAENLRQIMTKNPGLHVYVASGRYDLVIPYFSTDYTFSHLGLDNSLKKNITSKVYQGGHMMYLDLPVLSEMKKDLNEFYDKALKKG